MRVAQARYYPYGGIRWESGTTPTDYRFTGQRQDANIGLYDYGARFYDPLIGRFVSADSIVPGAGNPQALNRFAYALNNPLKYTDPSGHCPVGECIRDFLNGFWNQFGYNNALLPQAREALAVQPNDESTAMIVGRIVGNIASAVQAGLEIDAAIGIGGGGAAACSTAVLCLAGAPAIAAGVGMAGHATFVGANAIEEGGKLANILLAKGSQTQGQEHHVISNKIMDALNKHKNLKGSFKRDDLITRAADFESHKGYQNWHRAYDEEVVEWLQEHGEATREEFLDFLKKIYSRSDVQERFPDAMNLLEQTR